MIDVFLLMLSMAAHGAAQGVQDGAQASLPPAVSTSSTTVEAPITTTNESPATTAPAPATGSTTVPPTFLAPSDDTQTAAAAPPTFLSPSDSGQGGGTTPLFLSPSDAPKPALQAEPQVPTGKFTIATEVKPILGMTKGNWIAVREFNGQDLVYVTHLWSWRCGLLEMKVGINGAAPENWPLPDCHMDLPAPNSILQSDGLPYREFGSGSVQQVEVLITYDDLSTDAAKFNRQGVQIE